MCFDFFFSPHTEQSLEEIVVHYIKDFLKHTPHHTKENDDKQDASVIDETQSNVGEVARPVAPSWEHFDPLLMAAFTETDHQSHSLATVAGMDDITRLVIIYFVSLLNLCVFLFHHLRFWSLRLVYVRSFEGE